MGWWLFLCGCLALAAASAPEQVHISYGYQPSQMVVMWSTEEYGDSVVTYGKDLFHLSTRRSGSCWRFTDGNPQGLQYLHRVLLEVGGAAVGGRSLMHALFPVPQELEPGAAYWYYVQTQGNASDVFRFTAMPEGQGWSPRMLVYGDMGREGGSESLPALYQEVTSGDYTAILHVGDFAYDLDTDGGEVSCTLCPGHPQWTNDCTSTEWR